MADRPHRDEPADAANDFEFVGPQRRSQGLAQKFGTNGLAAAIRRGVNTLESDGGRGPPDPQTE